MDNPHTHAGTLARSEGYKRVIRHMAMCDVILTCNFTKNIGRLASKLKGRSFAVRDNVY